MGANYSPACVGSIVAFLGTFAATSMATRQGWMKGLPEGLAVTVSRFWPTG